MHFNKIVIIGGGFSGIGMAIRLRQRGIDDFVILERASDHGGTWRDNSYPGCACDVESSLYSFSFAPNPDWSHSFAPQAEIWEYLRRCSTAYDIDRHFAFSQNVTGATWDDAAMRWTVTTDRDTWRAQVVVQAGGPLSDPIMPAIPGLEKFAGQLFHSARWNHAIDLTAKRVAVIGTGASAIQFVPQIQPKVAHLDVYQRTPPWVLPRNDTVVPSWRKSLYRAIPFTQRVARGALYLQHEALHLPFRNRQASKIAEWRARRFLESEITDSVMRAKLLPHYRVGCKRLLLSDDYYPALRQPNVSLVTDPIVAIDAKGIQLQSGARRDADIIIFGTGFRPTDPPLAPTIVGRDGVSLAQAWNGSPHAYMGTTVAGFPNLFSLLGPNTGLGHSSVLLMTEAQIAHVLALLKLLDENSAQAVEPLASAQTAYVADIHARLAPTTWNAGGCSSWYLDRTGRNSTIWPDGVGSFVRTVSRVRADDYRVTPVRATAPGIHA